LSLADSGGDATRFQPEGICRNVPVVEWAAAD
jgi:hypothetical protein